MVKRKLRRIKKELKEEIEYFHREFRKHLTNFITGALAFVAALLWRDAIKSFLESYKTFIESNLPFKELWIAQFIVAFAVSVIAVAGIVLMTKLLKPEK